MLSAEQNTKSVTESRSLLDILLDLTEKNLKEIITEDEPWFAYLVECDAMFESSPAQVIPRVRAISSSKKVMMTLFHSKWPSHLGCLVKRLEIQSRLFH
jgi:hypothetical protein